MNNPRDKFDNYCDNRGNCENCDYAIPSGDRIDCLAMYSYQQGIADERERIIKEMCGFKSNRDSAR